MGIGTIRRFFDESFAVVVFGIAVCVFGYISIGAKHSEEKQKTLETLYNYTDKIAEAAEARLAMIIKNAELTLTHISELNKHSLVCLAADIGDIRLERVGDIFGTVDFVSLLNQDGRVICADVLLPSREVWLDDRDYFLALRDAAPGSIALGVPVLSRVSERWILPLAKRLEASGNNSALAVTGIDLTSIVEGLESQRPRPNGSMTLYFADKRIIAAAPFDPSVVGKFEDQAELWRHYPNRRHGRYEAEVVAREGVTQILSFRQVNGYPLVLAVGAVRDDALAEWTKDGDLDHLFLAMAGFAIMAFAFALASRLSKLRDARRESRRLALVAEHTGNMVVIADPEGRIEWVNKSFEQVSGWRLDEIRGQKPGAFLFGPETSSDTKDEIRLSLRERRPIDGIEILNYSKEKRKYWVRLNIRPVFDDFGRVIAFVGVQEDLTASKQAEKRSRDLAEQIAFTAAGVGVGIWTVEPLDRVTRWDARCHELLAVEAGADSQARETLLSRILPEDMPIFDAAIRDVVRDGKALNLLFRVRLPSGKIRYLHTKGIAERDNEGVTHRILGIVWDVTETKELELHLTAERKRAEEASAAKTEFLSMMSHELRTPLNAVIGFAQMLEGEYLGPIGHARYRAYATDIRQSGELLLALISGVLDINRIDRVESLADRIDVSVRTVLEEINPIIVETVAAGGHELNIDIDPSAVISADPLMIKQLVINLVTNATKYTNAGGHIRIVASRGLDGTVRLTVSDNGIGMDTSSIARAMEPFVRLNRNHKKDVPGLGLGLAIVKKIVDVHNAKLDIVSEPGSGTEVTATFKVHP